MERMKERIRVGFVQTAEIIVSILAVVFVTCISMVTIPLLAVSPLKIEKIEQAFWGLKQQRVTAPLTLFIREWVGWVVFIAGVSVIIPGIRGLRHLLFVAGRTDSKKTQNDLFRPW